MKKIVINHLGYTIKYGLATGHIKKLMEEKGMNMAITDRWDNGCSLYWKNKPKNRDIPNITHEIVHILQHICEVRFMEFTKEEENLAYIAHYILNKILELEYWLKKK